MCVLRGCVLALAFASATAAPAGATVRLGQAGGVRIHPGKGGWVVTFNDAAAKTFRSVRGRDVTLTCTRLDPTPGLLAVDDRVSATARAPQSRRPIRVGLAVRAYDLCELTRATDSDTPVVTVALSQRGAVVVDERAATQELVGVISLATLLAPKGSSWPAADAVVKRGHGHIVALAAPGDAPPAGQVGYFSDAAAHMTVATLSSAGRRLFVDIDGDVTATNVLAYLNR